MDWPRIEAIVYDEEAAPRDLLAPRIISDGILVQGYFPGASQAVVLSSKKSYPMEQEDEAGYFAAVIPGRKIPRYRYRVTFGQEVKEFYDAYAFPGGITEEEERAFMAGVFYDVYRKLGAHPVTMDGVKGVSCAVWAPNAVRVSVVGGFNGWDGRFLPMHRMPMSGIFELFVPGLKPGEAYLYEIRTKQGSILKKVDPYGQAVVRTNQKEPVFYSLVPEEDAFSWSDDAWIRGRKKLKDRNCPISICETSLSEWENVDELLDYVKTQRYSHVEFFPLVEPLDERSEGYAAAAFFAPGAKTKGTVALKTLIDKLHANGIGVIVDWTPAQFPAFDGGLQLFDGTALYEPSDESVAVHPRWCTLLYNYDSPMVKDFLLSNARYLIEEFHVDGLRVDDVDAMLYLDYYRQEGSWKPNIYGSNENLAAVEFIKHLNSILHKDYPGVMVIAQEDGLWPELTSSVEEDHPGFDYKWNTGWTNDLLAYLGQDPILRKNFHDQLTVSMLYAYCEHYILTLGKRDIFSLNGMKERFFGDEKQKDAQVREALAYQLLHPGCKMTAAMPEAPGELRELLASLNELYRSHPALYELDFDYEGFEWIQLTKYDENVLAFLRKAKEQEEELLAVFNFAAIPYEDYHVGVPFAGRYKEILNTDQKKFGGTGFVNSRVKTAKAEPCDEREYSISIKLASLSAAIFNCTPE